MKKIRSFIISLFRQKSVKFSEEMAFEAELGARLRKFEKRKIYKVLSPKIINTIADDDLEQAIIDYIDVKVGKNYHNQYQIVTSMSKGFQAIYTTWWVEAEVNNGGFDQYFFNSTQQFALEALEGFIEIGAVRNATLMGKAIQIAIRKVPEMKKYREEGALDAFSETYKTTELTQLDDEFFEYPEDLSRLRIDYIRRNLDLFCDL